MWDASQRARRSSVESLGGAEPEYQDPGWKWSKVFIGARISGATPPPKVPRREIAATEHLPTQGELIPSASSMLH